MSTKESIVQFNIFEKFDNLKAVFSTRKGGISKIPFESMNLGLNTADDISDVIHNMDIILNQLKLDGKLKICTKQVHGDNIIIIDEEFLSTAQFDGNSMCMLEATDGLVISTDKVAAFTYYADCTSLYAYDPVNRIVGIAHSGWKGTVARIGEKLLKTMESRFGSDMDEVLWAIGPTAESCCYEVDEKVRTEFVYAGFDVHEFMNPGKTGKYMVSMSKANLQVLTSCGVHRKNIEISGICTICNEDLFYSHRRDGKDSGRMSGIIALI